jgi:hypothetical protein
MRRAGPSHADRQEPASVVGFLHITNGDHAADLLKASGIGGDLLPWRDPMHHGPFPPDLDLDAVSDVRARYLAGDHNDGAVQRNFRERNEALRAAGRYDEVILWFEHDLLDQLQLLQLLDWFAGADLGSTRLTMICIDRFPDIVPFRGLGQLTAAQIASLLPSRVPVTPMQLAQGRDGWAAFRSTDPTTLLQFLHGELTSLPFLRAALERHFEEYPWSRDGLTKTERQIISVVSAGISAPGRIFVANMQQETVLFEGDLTTFQHIAELSRGSRPLLRSAPHGSFRLPAEGTMSRDEFLAQRVSLTRDGEFVQRGETDAWDLIRRDQWLGGVHLQTGHAMWMWDADAATLRRRDQQR